MKILFSMRHPGALRNYASTLKELARRGNQIHLAFMMQDKLGDTRLLWELSNDHPEITYLELGKKTPWRFWLGLARALRFTTDYVRYLTPDYADATALRNRAGLRIPRAVRVFFDLPIFRPQLAVRAAAAFLRTVERALPLDRWIRDIVVSQNPDVVLITPLVDLGSDQVEYVKAARALGIRSGLCVHSWDNLTNKGLIRVLPDRVFVWNEAQKREAVAMHRVKPEQVGVTGAPVYDQWFARTPSTTRQEFCAKTELSPDRPFFLYLCSSQFIAPDEAEFVADWIRAVRSAPDPRVREAGILIRPHPENTQPWQRFDFDNFPGVVLWPRGGANPVDASSKNDYFDSLYHSVAAVGVNTSAQIEAGVVGRPVYSVRVEKYQGTQEGTLHFHYLLKEGGGLLHMAETLEEHARALSAALDRTEEDARKLRAFVEAFVRPNGFDVPATPILAGQIEELGRLPRRAPERLPLWLYPLRAALYPIAWVMKIVRSITRLSHKRQKQLRPLSFGNWFWKRMFWLLDWVFKLPPMKRFAKRYIVPRVVPQMASGDTPTEEMIAIPRTLQKLARSDRPIVIGPWLSEVGFELLYWIPFLNWVKTYRHFDAERLIVVSRGGVAPWYRDIAGTYLDLFDFYTPEQFRVKNEQRLAEAKQKHLLMSQFDREILKLVYQHIGSKHVDSLHPMYMYRLFYPFWKQQMSIGLVDEFASFQRLPAVDAADVTAGLPRDYIAVRFYFNESFPDTEENKLFVTSLLDTLTETNDVVLLNPDLHIDDHWDMRPGRNQRIHTVDHLMTPQNNLAVQTKVISRARAFVGTYGGLSYLAPLYGVTSLAFYSHRERFNVQHLELARRVFGRFKRGSYVVLDTSDLSVLGLALGEQRGPLARLLERSQLETEQVPAL
jgi:hypothetical protein